MCGNGATTSMMRITIRTVRRIILQDQLKVPTTFTVEEAGGVGLGIAVFPTVMLTILVTATVLSDSVWLCKHRNVWPLPLVCLNKLYLC